MEVPRGMESRSTNMSSLSCGTVYVTIICLHRHAGVFNEGGQPFAIFVYQHFRVFGSGGLAGGLYPISFRTRQSSLLAAMVLIVLDGESS